MSKEKCLDCEKKDIEIHNLKYNITKLRNRLQLIKAQADEGFV